MANSLNIIFAGTPDFAAKHLAALYASEHNVVAVYTQPDRPAGRGKKLMPSAVKTLALENNSPVFQPASLKNAEAQEELKALNADIMIVVAYGLILPKAVLETPKLGCLNVHGSLLPKWRGAAPIQRAIWAGDKFTGISIMQMDEGLDTGAVLLEKSMAITGAATSASLYDDLAELGPEALIETLDNLENLTPSVQNDEEATYAHKLSKEEARIDWTLSAHQLARNVRAFNPWPVVWFAYGDESIKVWQVEVLESFEELPAGTIVNVDKNGIEVATGEHNLLLTLIQIPGKKAQAVSDIINGKPDMFVVGHRIA
ncbi:methionyl-tRNA formyltransferase [Glaciecola sp. MF2-115]|uniref:methionyl-tRNA formyltransferase n=1 Tax=Glaciecola sp. MF2-115 TaxID=3384827 RepID=UPI0039A3EBF5